MQPRGTRRGTPARLAEQMGNDYIFCMIIFQKERVTSRPPAASTPPSETAHSLPEPLASPAAAPVAAAVPDAPAPAAEPRREASGAWRVLPLEGRYEIAYADASGRPSRRRIDAAELKVGPGKLLLGGVDADLEAYRGFRVDRINALRAVETGETVNRNIVDWLLAQADRLARAQRRAQAAAAKPRKRKLSAAAA
jgi:hypothetical protein